MVERCLNNGTCNYAAFSSLGMSGAHVTLIKTTLLFSTIHKPLITERRGPVSQKRGHEQINSDKNKLTTKDFQACFNQV